MIDGLYYTELRRETSRKAGWWQVRIHKRVANCKSESECQKLLGLIEWILGGEKGNKPKGNDTLVRKARWLVDDPKLKVYHCSCGNDVVGIEKQENGVTYTEYKCDVCEGRTISRLDRIAIKNGEKEGDNK